MNTAVIDVTSRRFDDSCPGYIAMCDEFPGFIGHGDDDDEAVEDLVGQIEARTIH